MTDLSKNHDASSRARTLNPYKPWLAALVTLLGTSLATSTGYAAVADEESEDKSSAAVLQRLNVTGTRIRQIDMEGSSPVVSLDRDAIEQSGAMSLQDLLALLPEAGSGSFSTIGNDQDDTAPGGAGISLRGLGADATLVLVNGRRVAVSPWAKGITTSFVDINAIPLAAIERVEVLKDGASALYGSDAIAGVVNIILRESYNGVTLTGSFGDSTADEDASETRLSLMLGASGDAGRGLVVIDYYKRNALAYSDREVSETLDHRSQGGTDMRSAGGYPGTFLTPDGVWHIDPACPPEQISNGFCRFDYIKHQYASPQTERVGAFATWTYDLSQMTQLFTEVQMQRNNTLVVGAPSPTFFNFTIPAAHPDNPYGADLQMAYRFVESGPRAFDIDVTNLRGLIGLRGMFMGWDWETAYHISRSEADQVGISGMVNQLLAQQAIDDFSFSPFGGASNPAAVVDGFTVPTVREGQSRMEMVDARLSGPIMQMPFGFLGFAAGLEYREESIRDEPDLQFQQGLIIGTEATQARGERDVTSGYIELLVPAWEGLEVQLALRYDDYSDFGSTTNPKVGVLYQLNPSVSLRGSWGTGFRAPSLAQVGLGPTDESPVLVDELRCATAGGTYCDPAEFPVMYSGNPDLDAEESESLVLGAVLQISDPLAVTLDYWRYEIEDGITTDTRQLLLAEANDPTSLPPGTIVRGTPSADDVLAGVPGRITEINDVLRNAATQETDGIDFGIRYRQQSEIGLFSGSFSVTHVLSFDEQLNEAAPTEDLNGKFERPETRWSLTADLDRGTWGATAIVHYIGEFDDNDDAGPVSAARTVDSWTTLDLQTRVTMPWSGEVRVGMTNVLDEEVPFSAGTFQGFVPSTHDPMGRFAYVAYTHRFE